MYLCVAPFYGRSLKASLNKNACSCSLDSKCYLLHRSTITHFGNLRTRLLIKAIDNAALICESKNSLSQWFQILSFSFWQLFFFEHFSCNCSRVSYFDLSDTPSLTCMKTGRNSGHSHKLQSFRLETSLRVILWQFLSTWQHWSIYITMSQ